MKRGQLLWSVIILLLCTNGYSQEISKGEITNQSIHETYTPSFDSDGTDIPVKNIILMIGDGMGLAHISSALYANNGKLTLANLRTCGFVKTQSADQFTTDSAASGTAYSTGVKTKNGALGVNEKNEIIKNLPENLIDFNIVSGIVTTDNLDGATPAAFFAHQPNRNMSTEIWRDIIYSPLSFFAAGSLELLKKQPKDFQEKIKQRFKIVDDLKKINTKDKQSIGYLPPQKETSSKADGRGNYLPETTQAAIDFLSKKSENGFFLMVEGARIDKSAHKNDFSTLVREVLDFDLAVEKAIRFAEAEGNTLVIITADHETGALSLRSGNLANNTVKGVFVSKGHTPIIVPLFAFGPHSREFSGIQENNDVSDKILNLLIK